MNVFQFNRLDLNLLRVLDAVYRTGNLRLAGEQLSVTPSAISHSLSRLRAALGDKLFIPSEGRMRPTPRCRQIAAEAERLIVDLRKACEPPDFSPECCPRRFRVVCNPYMSAVFMPEVVRRVAAAAPLVQINLVSSEYDLDEELSTGRCDLAFGSFLQAPEPYQVADLFEETMVWVVRAGHSLARARLTLDALLATPHLVVAIAPDEKDQADIDQGGILRRVRRDDGDTLRALAGASGTSRRIALTVADAPTALQYLQQSDLAALLPRRLVAPLACSLGLKYFEPPYGSASTTVQMIWYRHFGASPEAEWLRAIVQDVARAMPPVEAVRSPILGKAD